MPPRKTRSAKVTVTSEDVDVQNAQSGLPASSTSPPMLFILPNGRSIDSRILSLPHPASGKPTRFYFDPAAGLYEFTCISAPRSAVSNWLLAPEATAENGATKSDDQCALATGYAAENPSLLVATPIDPVLMMLPIMLAGIQTSERQLYLTMDDHLDKAAEYSKDLAEILRSNEILAQLEKRLQAVCDTIEAGDDTMYRVNADKLAADLLAKAEKVCAQGLPASMEQRFVQDLLQVPSVAVDASSLKEEPATSDVQPTPTSESQVSDATTAITTEESQTSQLSVSTTATSVDNSALEQQSSQQSQENAEMVRLLRLRTALNFILASYVGPAFHATIRIALDNPKSGIDFALLNAHLKRIEEAKKEAQALRSLSDNISRKRRNEDDDEQEEIRAEKRRKKEEEDAKKKAQSRAMKQLAKADTSGMKKLSSFFTKAPAKKAA